MVISLNAEEITSEKKQQTPRINLSESDRNIRWNFRVKVKKLVLRMLNKVGKIHFRVLLDNTHSVQYFCTFSVLGAEESSFPVRAT